MQSLIMQVNRVSAVGSPFSLGPTITKHSCQYLLADFAGCNLHLHCKGNKRLSPLSHCICHPSQRLQSGPELTTLPTGIFLRGF